MSQSRNHRRGAVIGISALAGLGFAALGVVGVAAHEGTAVQQQDVALVSLGLGDIDGAGNPANAADVAHSILIDAQTAQLSSYFDQNVVGLQQSIYYYAQSNDISVFPGNASDPSTSLFNGAFTRYFEAQEVSQAIQQAQWDHLLGVNQTLGAGGYETAIANALYVDISGTGIPDTGALHEAVEALNPETSTVLDSASGFQSALTDLHGDLMQTAISDYFGAFSL